MIFSFLHPKHWIYEELFEHLAKSFPHWSETIEKVYHDKEERVFITTSRGKSSTIKIYGIYTFFTTTKKIKFIELKRELIHFI